jgi:hypothetical protein
MVHAAEPGSPSVEQRPILASWAATEARRIPAVNETADSTAR